MVMLVIATVPVIVVGWLFDRGDRGDRGDCGDGCLSEGVVRLLASERI